MLVAVLQAVRRTPVSISEEVCQCRQNASLIMALPVPTILNMVLFYFLYLLHFNLSSKRFVLFPFRYMLITVLISKDGHKVSFIAEEVDESMTPLPRYVKHKVNGLDMAPDAFYWASK